MLNYKFLRPLIALTMALGLCFSAFADTIRLKDGSIVKGRVAGFKDGQFVVIIGDGARQRQMSFYSDEIATIEFDGAAIPAASQNASNATTTVPQNPPTVITSTTVKPIENTAGNNSANNRPAPQTVNANASKNSVPVRLNAKVLADNTSNGWTNTGWVVKKGQRIRIVGTGRIALGNGRYTTPSGVASLPDGEKLLKDKPTGGMIAVVGDDNNEFIFVGSTVEFTATRDGALFLGVNEGYLDDNSGAYDVVIEIDPS